MEHATAYLLFLPSFLPLPFFWSPSPMATSFFFSS
jgi:hypothetical protein